MTKNVKLMLGGALFCLMGLYWGATSWREIRTLATASDCGLESLYRNGKVLIAQINLEDYSPVLHPGDEILGIKEFPQDSPKEVLDGMVKVAPGTAATFLVKCSGNVYEVPITTQPRPLHKRLRSIANLVTPWTFFLTGLIVLLLRADEYQAWLLAMMLGSFVGSFGSDSASAPVGFGLILIIARSLGILFLPLFFNFFLCPLYCFCDHGVGNDLIFFHT